MTRYKFLGQLKTTENLKETPGTFMSGTDYLYIVVEKDRRSVIVGSIIGAVAESARRKAEALGEDLRD